MNTVSLGLLVFGVVAIVAIVAIVTISKQTNTSENKSEVPARKETKYILSIINALSKMVILIIHTMK